MLNADRFSIASGHRNYFYDQKTFYINEIQRISELMEKQKYKKREYKKLTVDIKIQMERETERLEKDIEYFREKVIILFINLALL